MKLKSSLPPLYKLAVLLVVLTIGFSYPGTVFSSISETPDPNKMLEQMDKVLRGNSHEMLIDFYVKTTDWERHYKIQVWMKGLDYAFARILEPPKAEGQGYLRIKFRIWNYLPSAERTILIPPSLMTDRALGSDFATDDLVKLSYLPRDYEATIVKEDIIDNFEAYRLELKPRPDAPISYEKLDLWLRKSDSAPLRLDFYDEDLRHIRTLSYSGFKTIDGLKRPTVWHMQNKVVSGRESTITVLEVHYGIDIPESFFSQENLEKEI